MSLRRRSYLNGLIVIYHAQNGYLRIEFYRKVIGVCNGNIWIASEALGIFLGHRRVSVYLLTDRNHISDYSLRLSVDMLPILASVLNPRKS